MVLLVILVVPKKLKVDNSVANHSSKKSHQKNISQKWINKCVVFNFNSNFRCSNVLNVETLNPDEVRSGN